MAQLISNLPVGAKVKFGTFLNEDLVWIIVDKNHSGYPSNSITLRTEGIIYELAFDACEEFDSGVIQGSERGYGDSDYSLSNIRQWLNSRAEANDWYSPQRDPDFPPSTEHVQSNPYSGWKGFLRNFSDDEYSLLLDTEVNFVANYTTKQVIDKIFLLGHDEVGFSGLTNLSGQTALAYGSYDDDARSISLSSQYAAVRGLSSNVKAPYWLRDTRTIRTFIVYGGGTLNDSFPVYSHGIVPVCNITADSRVSDTTDADGCYIFEYNIAPPAPSVLNVPTTVYGGKISTISWNAITDPDGDVIHYVLEASYDGGSFEQIYRGTATRFNHSVTYGKSSIQYRIKAVDSQHAESGYVFSGIRTITNNNTPVISGSDTNLGIKTCEFSQIYSVTDQDGDSVTVVEAIDGVQIRSFVCTLGVENAIIVNALTWLKLSNGTHSLTIRAKDSKGGESVRTFTFVKNLTYLSVSTSNPLESDNMPTRITFTVNRNIPPEAEIKVEVCNNGFDSSPTWEDATEILTSNLVYVFTNTSKTASKWGVCIRVTVNRNGGEGACYISGIGGNFE